MLRVACRPALSCLARPQFLERGAGVSRGVVREVLNHRLCVAHPNIVQARPRPPLRAGPRRARHRALHC
jgi:hypothetical protein